MINHSQKNTMAQYKKIISVGKLFLSFIVFLYNQGMNKNKLQRKLK